MRLCSSPRASNRAGGRCGERICRSAGHCYGESDGQRAGYCSKPRWIPDIEWGDLEECPKDSIWFVVTDELPSAIGRPHVQFSSFYDQYFIDWGDGESYASPTRTNTLDFINHTYAKGTGNIDSKGREFWIMKAKFSNPAQSDIAPNGYVYVKVGVKLAWNISPIKYVVVGEDIDPDYNFEFNQGWDHLEAIRFKGKDRSIRDFPSFLMAELL